MCFCHNKTFVATKIILVAVPANDSDKLDCPLLLVPASIQFLQHQVSMISHVEYSACDKLDCPLQLVPASIQLLQHQVVCALPQGSVKSCRVWLTVCVLTCTVQCLWQTGLSFAACSSIDSFCSTRLSVFFHNGVWSPAGCDLLSAHTGNWINHGILCHSQVNAGACFKIKFNVAFTSTETIRIIRDGKPKTSTLTFTQLLSRSLYLTTRLIVGTRPCSDL